MSDFPSRIGAGALDRASSLVVVSPKHATDDRIIELSRDLASFFQKSKKVDKTRKKLAELKEVLK